MHTPERQLEVEVACKRLEVSTAVWRAMYNEKEGVLLLSSFPGEEELREWDEKRIREHFKGSEPGLSYAQPATPVCPSARKQQEKGRAQEQERHVRRGREAERQMREKEG